MITVFTPAYNRAGLLRGLYESLCRQTSGDFEWIVVDDGSTDDTPAVMRAIEAEAWFPMQYVRKENGGKHSAINVGVKLASGELFFIVDSDDELPETSIETLVEQFEPVKDDLAFGGVCGYVALRSGKVVGRPLVNADVNTIDLRYKMGVKGDMREVFRTEVMREFPFPEFEGERFCPEILVWNRIARKYKLRVFDKVIYLCDYLEGGLTDRITEVRKQSPRATCLCYKEMMALPIPLKYRLRALLNYLRFSIYK